MPGRPQNPAAENLARLTQAAQASQQQAVQDAAIVAERADTPLFNTNPEEAKFALPEALATGAIGSWLFGPAGVLLGAAQGWLGKKTKQNELDRQAASNEAVTGAEATLRGQFDELEAGAKNDNDREILSSLRTQQNAAFQMIRSGDERVQQAGMALMQSVQDEVNNYASQQEVQLIEEEARADELARQIGQEGYDRFTTLEDDFTAESASFEEVMTASNLALEALERGTPADLSAAIKLIEKALDPTSVVRPEEQRAYAEMGSLIDRSEAYFQQLARGEPLIPEQRRELSALVESIRAGATKLQLSREARYKDQLVDAEVPVKYWRNFTRVENVPAYTQGPIEGQSTVRDVIDTTSDAVTEGVENVKTTFDESVDAYLEGLRERGERAKAYVRESRERRGAYNR